MNGVVKSFSFETASKSCIFMKLFSVVFVQFVQREYKYSINILHTVV